MEIVAFFDRCIRARCQFDAYLRRQACTLALQFWRDDAREAHRAAQCAGCSTVLRDRLRIAGVTRDEGLKARDEAAAYSRQAQG